MTATPKQEVVILSSNVSTAESGMSLYSEGTTYKEYDYCYTTDGNIWRFSDVTTASGINPETDTTSKWSYFGKTNYYRAFDPYRSSSCTNADTITYSFSVTDIDTLTFLKLNAKSVSVSLINDDTGETVISETYETYDRDVYDWHDWTYAQSEFISSLYIPFNHMVLNGTLSVTIDNTGSTASVGHIVYGRSLALGVTLASPEPVASIRNITSKERNQYTGVIELSDPITYKRVTCNVLVDSASVDRTNNRLEKLNGTPCLFVGDNREDGYSSLMAFGLHRDFDQPIGAIKTQYQIQIEGFI